MLMHNLFVVAEATSSHMIQISNNRLLLSVNLLALELWTVANDWHATAMILC